MIENTLKIIINRPAKEIFDFVLNPDNTPKWIDSIKHEEVNPRPAQLGAIFSNVNALDEISHYEVIEIKPSETFTLREQGGHYNVRYTLIPLGGNQTQFIYHEWVDEGALKDPFIQSCMEKLKEILESQDTASK